MAPGAQCTVSTAQLSTRTLSRTQSMKHSNVRAEFDSHIPKRAFDNFDFVDFTAVEENYPTNSHISFACYAVAELPGSYFEHYSNMHRIVSYGISRLLTISQCFVGRSSREHKETEAHLITQQNRVTSCN